MPYRLRGVYSFVVASVFIVVSVFGVFTGSEELYDLIKGVL